MPSSIGTILPEMVLTRSQQAGDTSLSTMNQMHPPEVSLSVEGHMVAWGRKQPVLRLAAPLAHCQEPSPIVGLHGLATTSAPVISA